MFSFNTFSRRRKESIRWWNYLFAFAVAFFIPVASVYIHSYFVLWRGNLYQVVDPLDDPEKRFICLCFGAISFLALIPFLRIRSQRWFVALALCAIWLWLGLLQVAKMK